MGRVYKIIAHEAWAQACAAGRFEGAAIDLKDGYIHLSTGAQAPDTARLHFRDQAGLAVVAFEAEAFGETLKWEPSRGGQLFPHVYGPIDTALAVSVTDAPLDGDGAPRIGPLP